MAQIHISDELRQSYLDYTNDCLNKLDDFLLKARSDDADIAQLRKDIFAVAHDLKGMGGSFDFQLMTDAGSTLCVYFRSTEEHGGLDDNLLETHIKSMRTIIDNNITGDGGPMGEKLMSHLKSMVEQAIDEN